MLVTGTRLSHSHHLHAFILNQCVQVFTALINGLISEAPVTHWKKKIRTKIILKKKILTGTKNSYTRTLYIWHVKSHFFVKYTIIISIPILSNLLLYLTNFKRSDIYLSFHQNIPLWHNFLLWKSTISMLYMTLIHVNKFITHNNVITD